MGVQVGLLAALQDIRLEHNPVTGLPIEVGALGKLERVSLRGAALATLAGAQGGREGAVRLWRALGVAKPTAIAAAIARAQAVWQAPVLLD